MSSILLCDYVNQRKRYILDPETGSVAETLFDGPKDDMRNVSGFGSYRTCGLLHNRTKLFIAAYAVDDDWLVRVGSSVFNMSRDRLDVRRDTKYVFWKTFRIREGNSDRFAMSYLYSDSQIWPDNGDICSYIERMARDESYEALLYIWDGTKRGSDITSREFIGELERIRSREKR